MKKNNAIIKAIYESGMKENHKGIVFSLPVESTAGLKYDLNEEEVVNK